MSASAIAELRQLVASYLEGSEDAPRAFELLDAIERKSRTYLVARFDVTGLAQHHRETLGAAVCAQAEGSYGHPTVTVTIEEVVVDE